VQRAERGRRSVDQNCVPLRKAIQYGIDARAVDEMDYLTKYYGPDNGCGNCSAGGRSALPTACEDPWLKNNEPGNL
jgi:xylulokinase